MKSKTLTSRERSQHGFTHVYRSYTCCQTRFYMFVKRMVIKITLFAIGIVLMYITILMGRGIAIREFESTGFFV